MHGIPHYIDTPLLPTPCGYGMAQPIDPHCCGILKNLEVLYLLMVGIDLQESIDTPGKRGLKADICSYFS